MKREAVKTAVSYITVRFRVFRGVCELPGVELFNEDVHDE